MNLHLYSSKLILEDGCVYKGWSFFEDIYSLGEVIFNTGMTGYQEIMTDPSYAGQIITFTYPELGNTGLNNDDYESGRLSIKGIIAKNICYYPSNWRSTISLPHYLLKNQIPHIFGIDTRALTKHLRTNGVMKGGICSANIQFHDFHSIFNSHFINSVNLVNFVTTSHPCYINLNTSKRFIYSHLNYKISKQRSSLLKLNVVILDFGVKYNIINRILSYGCSVYVLPITSSYEVISSYKPDGILLSNGPGDPSILKFAINTVTQLVKFANIPIFGICMGHQILNLALGVQTFKLKFGHRGLNHPSGIYQKSEITSQNHGFAVNLNSFNKLNNLIKITHFNFNDFTIAGMMHYKKPIFSVQYHPEASPGPHDSDYLFKYFINLMYMNKK